MAKKLLALSVENGSLNLLMAKGFSIQAWTNVPLDLTLLRNDFVMNADEIAEVLKQTLGEQGFSGKQVLASVPGFGSVFRVIEVPQVRDIRPEEVLPREARRLMPIALEENYLFWQELSGHRARRRFFVLAVPKEPVQTLLKLLKRAGLHPLRIDSRPLALARAVNRPQALIAAAEQSSLDVILIEDHVPLFVRSLYLGDQALPSGSLATALLDELRRAISFHNESHPEQLWPQEPIYLCGAQASSEELARILEGKLGYGMVEPQPPFSYPPDFPASRMMTNLGLLLKVL